MYIEVLFRCKVCGLKGHGEAALSPGTSVSTLHGIKVPDGWHIETKGTEYVAHCSQRCLYHTDRGAVTPRLKRAETEN